MRPYLGTLAVQSGSSEVSIHKSKYNPAYVYRIHLYIFVNECMISQTVCHYRMSVNDRAQIKRNFSSS